MKVLVTGGAGYAGSVLARQLLGEGHSVRVVDALFFGGDSLLGLYPEDGFEFLRGDIRKRGVVRSGLEGVDAVVHLAAIVGDPACDRRPKLAREVNLDSTILLHEESRRAGVARWVFVSTCSNYGRISDLSRMVEEGDDLAPLSLYAETKVEAERALLSPAASPPVTVLRFATLFGISPRMRFDLVVNEFTRALLTKEVLDLYWADTCRPYLHVRDAARAIRLVLSHPEDVVGRRVFNVGDSGQNFTKRQLVSLICRLVGGEPRVQLIGATDRPRDYRVSFERIRAELGFQVTRTVEDGIREIIDVVRKGVVSEPRTAFQEG